MEASVFEYLLIQKCDKLRQELYDSGLTFVNSWVISRSARFDEKIRIINSFTFPENHKHSEILRDLEFILAVFTQQIDRAIFNRKITIDIDLSFYLIIFIPLPPLNDN